MKAEAFDNSVLESLAEIDKLVHEPARLRVMALLYVVQSADFLFLLNQTGLSKGNLSSHLSKLEAAGYLQMDKTFVNKIPRTLLHLTDPGREAFGAYMARMKTVMAGLENAGPPESTDH